jgi:tripartite-type tricarboxylate transporter receptor subunit TctC
MNRLIAVMLAALAGVAQAQQWPAAPVKVIVNVAAGGVADVTMRVLAARMGETLGQPFIVDNRPGGDGYIGFEAAMRAEADGSTLVYSPGSSMMISPHLVKRPDIDPLKAFIPVIPTAQGALYLVIQPGFPATTLAEFLAHARANPGKLNYGTPGNGTSPHVATGLLSREAKISVHHIPYKGAGPALKDLLGGVIDFSLDPGVALPQVKGGKLRLLAIVGPKRHPEHPNVPTLDESGLKGVDSGPPFGFYAPAGTPRGVVERLNREVGRILQEPAVRERFAISGVDAVEATTVDAFAAYVRTQSERYAKLLPELGITQ